MNTEEEERLRREASSWFARMRAANSEAARDKFDAWRATAAHQHAYDQLVRRFDESAILGHSRLSELRMRASPARRSRSSPALWGALAACLVAATGLGVAAWRGLGPRPGPGQQRYVTAVGEIRTVSLAGGVSVILDTDSQITAGARSGLPMLRLDRGRARIHSAGALTAEAGGARIRADQAVFDLRRLGDGAIDIAAMSGRVAIQAPDPGAAVIQVRDVRLAVGQQVSIRQGRPAPSQTAPAMSRDWPSGLLTFDGAPLATVIAEANRYGDKKIRLGEPGLGQLQVTGGFRVTRPEALSKALAAAFGLNLTRSSGGDLILSRRAA